MTAPIRTTVNGAPRELGAGTTVASLLADLGVATAGIAVAVNARIVRAAAFAEHPLHDGDAVEIVRAVSGG